MALSADLERKTRGVDQEPFILKSSDVSYKGSFMVAEYASGHVRNADDAADAWFVGEFGAATADSGKTGDGALKYEVHNGREILRSAAVTGYAAVTNNFQPVYISDDTTMTLTRPADDSVAIGFGLRFESSAVGDVYKFSLMDSFLYNILGTCKQTIHVGVVELQAGTGDVLPGIPLWGHGKIVDFFCIPDGLGAGAGADVDLNIEIGTTNTTGGVISVLLAGGQATAKLSATAFTAANEFYDGDQISVEAAENTAFTAGRVNCYIVIERLP